MSRQMVRGGLALGALLLVLAVGVGLTVPGGLSSPGEEALSAVRGGSCSWPYYIDCSNTSVCVAGPGNTSIYYQYSGLGSHPFDPEMDYDVGICRHAEAYFNTTTCNSAQHGPNGDWFICS